MRQTPAARPETFLVLVTLILSLPVVACQVSRAQFDQRVFACDTSANDPACGTDDSGRAMGCFAARQIGATDFCANLCDGNTPTQPDGVCLSPGVFMDPAIELRSCQPSLDDPATRATNPLQACGQRGLACYRTDMLSDEGVCTTLNPCDNDSDCHDPVRSVCATTFLASLYAGATDLRRDHLYCLETGCKSRGTSCSPGETCLQEVIPPDAHPPDICVPNCDSALRCPPNFLCYKKVSTSLAPDVCIPGLLGFTCDSAIDCMFGQCLPTGIGYSVCTTDCTTDGPADDCQRFDGEQGKFSCIKNNGDPTAPGKCQTPDAYRGSICDQTADCIGRNADEVCNRFDPTAATGTCLLPCSADGKCPQRGGINHTCLPSGVPGAPPVCFPGYFGYPCQSDSNCVGDLTCNATGPGQPSICSRPCSKDDGPDSGDTDCHGDRWVAGAGFCADAALGLPICLPNNSLPAGSPCKADIACLSGMCNTATNVCAASPGGGS